MMIDTKSTTSILGEIRQPTSLERQINALKLLKHDIIGNQPRKEAWKSSGVLALLANILVSPAVSSTTWRGDEGKVILHAVTIVGSLAYGEKDVFRKRSKLTAAGGADCVESMEASHMFSGLMRALEAVKVNSAIVLASLRALNNIADAISLQVGKGDDQAFAAVVYSDQGQRNLRRIVEQNDLDSSNHRQTVLVARLLAKTCTTEERRVQAVASGFLEALSLNTARHASRTQAFRSGSSLGYVLRAVATVIQESSERADKFADLHVGHLTREVSSDRPVHRLFGWLLYLIKKESGTTRLMAIWIIAIYVRANHREAEVDGGIATSLVPLLVQVLDAPAGVAGGELYPDESRIIGDAPRILALLITEDAVLQETAFHAGAVAKLSKLLRQANEAVPKDRSNAFWGSKGPRGTALPQALYDQWVFREAILQALAAISSQIDDYRKAVIDNGAVVPVVECLKPLDASALAEQQCDVSSSELQRSVGNPVPVLLAACEAAKSLSRSVSTLRTSLVDANLAAPLALLLKHADLEVQISATAVICNIVLEFSPMRQAAVDSGILRLLCEHAHSTDARLKLNSLWALKHVVHSAPNHLKRQCLTELGPGWLRQALDYSQSAISRSGAPVLPAIEGRGPLYDDDEVHMIDSPGEWTGADDVAIREQALDFVRNLIAGDDSQEMVDHILNEVGQEKLFEMLANLLRSADDGEVTLAVLYIICNLAAGTPQHRMILVSQETLLRLVVPLFQHPRADIRSTCVYLVVNLTWTEDNADFLHCKSRAIELNKIGVMQQLHSLVEDGVHDVRERTKTAIHQMTDLLR